jgi:hypothetical protein
MSSTTHHLSAEHAGRLNHLHRESGFGLRARVYFRRARLDGLLAEGASPQESPEPAIRASQLTSMRLRGQLADSLEKVVRIARGKSPTRTACPPLARADIRACTAALLQLALGLREDGEVNVTGVVLAQRLLTDGTGPLYVYGRDDELWHATRRASAALEGYVA